MISDGLYFLHSEGGCWVGARFRGGKLRGVTSEDVQATHDAANDSWSGVAPSDDDAATDRGTAEAVVAAVMPDCDPQRVVVTRAAD